MMIERDSEIAQNFSAFEGLVATLLPEHQGEFALLSNKELVGVYAKVMDAMAEGSSRFGDGNFSIQRITNRPLDLGFLSYASSDRDTAGG